MSLASLLPIGKRFAFASRWRAPKGYVRPDRTRRPLIEGLELRRMMSITALTDTDSDSFGPATPNFSGNLVLDQFDSTLGTLIQTDVNFDINISNSFDGEFTNGANSS